MRRTFFIFWGKMENIINIKNLNFTYPNSTNSIIKNLSLTVKRNTFTTIIGENGSGKSTLAKLLIGINKIVNGTIEIDGLILSDESLNEIRGNVGMVFQNPDTQFVGATVMDDVAFGLENHLIPRNRMTEIIERSLKLVGMWDYRDQPPENLSGGQKQRVAIASAIAYNPQILILDEASSMLDPKGRSDLLKLILDLKTNSEMTILAITHDLTEALKSDYIYLIGDGTVKGQGVPQKVFADRKLIQENHLILPFILELEYQLKRAGIPITENWLTVDDLLDDLWTLNSKM